MSTARLTLPLLAALTLAATAASSTTGTHSPRTESRGPAPAPSPTKPAAPQQVAPMPSKPAFDPSKAFNDLGCVGCHGDDGVYRDEIKGALGKPVDQVARWIRNAPSIKADTDMPSFQGAIDEPDSKLLAGWMLDRAAHLK
jgi:mono/diheme cytochrome c family protein